MPNSKIKKINNLFGRVNRTLSRLDTKDGVGGHWSHQFNEDEVHEYNILGIKPSEEIEDEVISAFVWLWSVKDYIKKYSVTKNYSPKWVEEKVNQSEALCLCADLANASKHDGLDRQSRSGKAPKFSNVSYSFPAEAVKSITYGAFDVTTEFSNLDLVDFEMKILDEKDHEIECAFGLLEKCIEAWEEIITEIK